MGGRGLWCRLGRRQRSSRVGRWKRRGKRGRRYVLGRCGRRGLLMGWAAGGAEGAGAHAADVQVHLPRGAVGDWSASDPIRQGDPAPQVGVSYCSSEGGWMLTCVSNPRRYVVANDLSASAVQDIRRNVEWNDLSPPGLPPPSGEESASAPIISKAEKEEATLGRVRPNEGDAWSVSASRSTRPGERVTNFSPQCVHV